MSDQLPDAYWNSLGKHAAFLRVLLDSQAQQLQQLQMQNQELHNQALATQSHLANVLSAANHTPTPAPTNLSSHRHIKVADPEKFSGERSETEGFIRAVKLVIAVQPESFPDERTKILYALSFMMGGSAQIWAHNETAAVIRDNSSTGSFEDFTKRVEETFGDPDCTQAARTKLHDLKMTSGMSADEYTAHFEMQIGRARLNSSHRSLSRMPSSA